MTSAFTLAPDDRFYCILISSPIKYQDSPDTETILAFFIIRRASGNHDIFQLTKTFKSDKCISRSVQARTGISAEQIGVEIKRVKEEFTAGIEQHTNLRVEWNELDLAEIENKEEQVKRIREWNRLDVFGSEILN